MTRSEAARRHQAHLHEVVSVKMTRRDANRLRRLLYFTVHFGSATKAMLASARRVIVSLDEAR